MHYRLKLPSEIKSRLKDLPEAARNAVGYGIFLLQEDLSGDIKKLKGFKDRYRLRVGHYRVLFQLDKDTIIVTILETERTSIDEHNHDQKARRDPYP